MAGGPLRCRCGIRLQPGDQLLQVVRRYGFLRDDKLRVGGDHRHRLKVVQHVVLERIDRRIDDMGPPMANADRVAVGRRARDPADADGAGGASRILDDDGLPKRCPHALGHDARNRIGRAPGRVRSDYSDRTRRIGLSHCLAHAADAQAGRHERKQNYSFPNHGSCPCERC